MKEEPKKGRPSFRKRLFVVGVGFFSLVMLVTSFFGKKGYMDLYRTRKSYQRLQTESRQLEEQRKELELEINDLETNPKSLEKDAREKLWLMQPDEKVLVIKERQAPSENFPNHAPTHSGR